LELVVLLIHQQQVVKGQIQFLDQLQVLEVEAVLRTRRRRKVMVVALAVAVRYRFLANPNMEPRAGLLLQIKVMLVE
jgi:hypothetical protein